VFPRTSPAIPFLLLLAIADDAMGLIVLAIFYPSGDLSPVMLGALLVPGMALAWTMRRFGVENFWLYILGPGALSWLGLFYGGLHPALALVPIVPLMPHGLPTLARFGAWWKAPVQIVLLAFGLVNAGVPLAAFGPVSWVVLLSLVAGKPIGIVGMALLAERLGLRRAPGLDNRALLTLGIAAGIGFTVALFVSSLSFPTGGELEPMAKIGILTGSIVAAALGTVFLARTLDRDAG
jgi:NhaA family Na+:H+ antiporter